VLVQAFEQPSCPGFLSADHHEVGACHAAKAGPVMR
jgi:hypothetical protein